MTPAVLNLRDQWLKVLKEHQYETPFILTDLNIVKDKIRQLNDLLPAVDIYYAIKSASNDEIIKTVDGLVSGFDIASLGEFKQLRRLGIDPSRMLYSNPVKVPRHIEETYKQGVRYYAFDSMDEIKKLAKYAPDSSVYLRLKVLDHGSQFPLSKKFGVDQLHATAYIGSAEDHGLKVEGISFHVGSQSENPKSWESAIKECGEIIRLVSQNGTKIKYLNIGGGLPADYKKTDIDVSLIASTINDALHKYIPEDIKVVAEPGRFISAESSVVVTSVIGREYRGNSNWLFVDMGVFQGLIEPLEMSDFKYPIFALTPNDKNEDSSVTDHLVTITGPTCDAYDTIGMDYVLPKKMKVGDRICIASAGAYSEVYASEFNGFEPPKHYFIGAE